MAVYHQMGHHSENLLLTEDLSRYSGAILSPVNSDELCVVSLLNKVRNKPEFEVIFDPQLYYPRSERGRLPGWSYFPKDVETADISSERWWSKTTDNVVETILRMGPSAACSPVFAPKVYNNDYFSAITRIGNYFVRCLEKSSVRPIQTVICSMADLSQPNRAYEIASIISQTSSESIYLIFMSALEPRREYSSTEEIKGAMRVISSLEKSGLRVIVGFSSTDMLLWKAAGATYCATGKFFNLRRFTPSRFEEPSNGQGQLPYWFEESLLAFLRESDVLRVRDAGLLSDASLVNPFGMTILEQFEEQPGKAWLAQSWRQYLYAFANLEHRISTGRVEISDLLKGAEKAWMDLDDGNILMEEMRNDGAWVRIWRRALAEFD